MKNYELLEARFAQVQRLTDVRNIVGWDEAVVMPAGSSPYRNEAMAELGLVIQNLVSGSEVGAWIEDGARADLNPWQVANLREMRRIYLENTAVPPALNQRLTIAKMNCEQAWRKLRAANDWTGFKPYLQEVLNLTRETIQEMRRHSALSAYDTGLSLFSPGLSTSAVEKLFGELKSFLPQMIDEVVTKQKNEITLTPEGPFPMAAQKALCLELMQAVGFDLNLGRLDESHHPFCGGNSRDVRITTRYSERNFFSSLMGCLHETGHALYEQHLPEAWLTQPVGAPCGMSIHESQSLLMEMQVCRSAEFMEFAGPIIRRHMNPFTKNPESLGDENLLRLATRVKAGLIRTEADEVTYPAHIILRFEIERDLLEGNMSLDDLPKVWDEKMRAMLGRTTVGNDKNGCMQDVHWPSGAFGYFPAYTFGAVIAAQLFARAQSERPSLKSEIARGDFKPLRDWLSTKIWNEGSLRGTLATVENAAGPLSAQDFRAHLENRYLLQP